MGIDLSIYVFFYRSPESGSRTREALPAAREAPRSLGQALREAARGSGF